MVTDGPEQQSKHDPKVGCAVCHPGPLFTDRRAHEVGTGTGKEAKGLPAGMPALPVTREVPAGMSALPAFDTPTLVECWRTAPYLHDGSAASMREVLTTKNRGDKHGRTSHLSGRQIDDLAEYVLSL